MNINTSHLYPRPYTPNMGGDFGFPKKSPTKTVKRPVSVSSELHELITVLAHQRNMTMEQIVSEAIVQSVKKERAPMNADEFNERYTLACIADREIKTRAQRDRNRRSVQMRRINQIRRQKRRFSYRLRTGEVNLQTL